MGRSAGHECWERPPRRKGRTTSTCARPSVVRAKPPPPRCMLQKSHMIEGGGCTTCDSHLGLGLGGAWRHRQASPAGASVQAFGSDSGRVGGVGRGECRILKRWACASPTCLPRGGGKAKASSKPSRGKARGKANALAGEDWEAYTDFLWKEPSASPQMYAIVVLTSMLCVRVTHACRLKGKDIDCKRLRVWIGPFKRAGGVWKPMSPKLRDFIRLRKAGKLRKQMERNWGRSGTRTVGGPAPRARVHTREREGTGGGERGVPESTLAPATPTVHLHASAALLVPHARARNAVHAPASNCRRLRSRPSRGPPGSRRAARGVGRPSLLVHTGASCSLRTASAPCLSRPSCFLRHCTLPSVGP